MKKRKTRWKEEISSQSKSIGTLEKNAEDTNFEIIGNENQATPLLFKKQFMKELIQRGLTESEKIKDL